MINVSLRVLDGLEKEQQCYRDLALDEVAATVDKEYKLSTILRDAKQIKDFLGIK